MRRVRHLDSKTANIIGIIVIVVVVGQDLFGDKIHNFEDKIHNFITFNKENPKKDNNDNSEKTKKDNNLEKLSSSEKNAYDSAKSYLAVKAFSKRNLINQLTSVNEGYSDSDATVAVNSLSVDWKEEARLAAKEYENLFGYSCKALINQLTSSAGDGYTDEEAIYAANKIGVCHENSNENLNNNTDSNPLEKILEISSSSKKQIDDFQDSNHLDSSNNYFHGLNVHGYSVNFNNDGTIKMVSLSLSLSYTLNDILNYIGKYCSITKWNRTNDDYENDRHVGNGDGDHCSAFYEKDENYWSVTYYPPNTSK